MILICLFICNCP